METEYNELEALGFKRYDYSDNVYYKEFGHDPFLMTFKLSKRISLEWDDCKRVCRVMKCDKTNSITFQKNLDLDQIEFLINLFGKKV